MKKVITKIGLGDNEITQHWYKIKLKGQKDDTR